MADKDKLSDIERLVQLNKDLVKLKEAQAEAEGRTARRLKNQGDRLAEDQKLLKARVKAIANIAEQEERIASQQEATAAKRKETAETLLHKQALSNAELEAAQAKLESQLTLIKAKAALEGEQVTPEMRKQAIALQDQVDKIEEANKKIKTQRKELKKIESLSGIGKLAHHMKGVAENAEKFKSAMSPVTGVMDKLFSAMVKTVFEFDNLTKGFERQMQLGPAYTQSIEEQYHAMVELGVSIEDATKMQQEMATTFTDFTMLGKDQRDIITENALVLAELGVAQEDFSKGIQNSTKLFGQSAGQAVVVQRELMATARALGREPGALAAEFAKAGPALAKFGNEGISTFKELSRISKITGLELDKVLNITNKFDTFEDAATMTGQLNAALGGNFVNAMDMMMATDPAERFGMVRDAIESAGLSFDEMSYYQKQFYAESLGLSDVGDLALMLSGNMDMLAGSTNKSAEALIEEKQRALDVQSAQEKLALTLQSVLAESTKLAPLLHRMVDLFATFAKHVDFLIPALITYKGVMIVLAVVTQVNAAAQALQVKGMGKTVFYVGLLAGVIFLLSKALGIASPSKVVLALFGMAAALYAVSQVGPRAAPGIQAMNPPLMQMAVAVGLVSLALAGLAIAFSTLSLEQMIGMATVFATAAVSAYLLAPALGILATGMAALGAAAVASAPGLLIAGAFIATLAGSVFVAAAGVGLMGAGMALMFDSISIDKAIAFGALVGALAIAGPFLAMAGLGFVAVGAGMLAFGLALKFIATKDLEAIAEFATGLSNINVSAIDALVKAIRKIADAMDDIPVERSIAFTTTMTSTAAAARAANTAGARAALGMTRVAGAGGAQAATKTEVTGQVEVKFNTPLFEEAVVNIIQRRKTTVSKILS
tara:strand:+ start:1999 stop:4662 length:2664 start_codon:yes stop_codon:yes gene_type:complete